MFSLFSQKDNPAEPDKFPSEASSDSLKFEDEKSTKYLHQLILGFVHKHNNFLTITQGFTELLIGEATDDYTRENLETVSKSARSAVDLNAKIIACASADQPNLLEVDLGEFLTQREAKWRQICSARKIELSLKTGKSAALLKLDPTWLDIVLDELIANACEVENSSAVAINIDQSCKASSLPLLRITNNGESIPSEVLTQAFSPFFSTKDRSHLGIGLTRAGFLAVKMSSKIRLTSEADKTVVEVSFSQPLLPRRVAHST